MAKPLNHYYHHRKTLEPLLLSSQNLWIIMLPIANPLNLSFSCSWNARLLVNCSKVVIFLPVIFSSGKCRIKCLPFWNDEETRQWTWLNCHSVWLREVGGGRGELKSEWTGEKMMMTLCFAPHLWSSTDAVDSCFTVVFNCIIYISFKTVTYIYTVISF